MKITFYILALLSYSYISLAQIPINGLIAYYKFDRPVSQTIDRISDYSGFDNDGFSSGGTSYTTDRHGSPCSALQFDGNAYVSIPNSPSLQSPQKAFSACVWFKIANGADFFKEWITILCKSDQHTESFNSPQYRMQATAQTISLNTEFTENFIPQLSYDVWYFYALVFDGQSVKVFLDGQFVFNFSYSGMLTPNNMPLELGRDLPGTQEYFRGTMDDLRIYNRALNEIELQKLYRENNNTTIVDRCSQHPKDSISNDKIADDAVIDVDESFIPSPNLPEVDTVSQETIDTAADEEKENPDTLPKELNGIPVEYQKVIYVKRRDITIYPYDNEKEDGDIVSIIINGEWVKDNYTLKNRKSPVPKNVLIKHQLTYGKNNYIISKAWNKGSIGLNTMTLEINDGVSVQNVMVNSEEGLSGGIRIICEK